MNLRNLGLPGLTKEEAEESLKIVASNLADVEKVQKEYEALGFTPGQKELYDKQIEAWKDFVAVGERVLAHFKAGTPADKEAMTEIFFGDCPKTAGKFTEATNALLAFHTHTVEEKAAAAEGIASNGLLINAMTVGIGVLVGLVLAYLFSKSLAGTLNRISQAISQTAEQTATGSQQLSSASSQLSSASTEAAASLEETVASLEELSSMVRLNTSSAQQANSLSQKSRESAENGDVEISKLIHAMSDIAQGSKKIEEIINVIDDIAFQTNLLALNASVEAARAGEQGKGFAVVAEAVRSLAQRSAVAAKDISTLIKDNVEKSEQGSKIADASSAVLKEILTSVKKVADLNGEIATGSQEQAHGLEQISKAMNQLDQATQGNAASSEEVAASSEEMAHHGHTLSALVKDLSDLVNGHEGKSSAAEVSSQKERKVQDSKKVVTHKASPAPTKKSGPSLKLVHSESKKSASSQAIPFDEDMEDGRGEVGDVSGF